MTEKGKVREIRDKLVIVAPERSGECFGCMKAGSIHTACKGGAGFITAENPAGLPLRTGQIVEFVTRGSSLFSQALIALLPPILGFLFGFNLIRFVFPFPAVPDGASIGMGLLFLFAAAFVVYLVRKKHPAGKGYKVTRILWE